MRKYGMSAVALAVMLASPGFAIAQSEVADAAAARNNDVVRQLLRDKADVNGAQADGATALHWAAYHGDADLAELLLDAGANPAAANRNGSTPLWLAASQGNAEMLETLLDGGADVNELLPLGRRPLMLAARSGVVDAVEVLLDHGADVNAKETQRGTNALMQAADQGHADVAALLIEKGADVAAVSAPIMRDGRTAALGQSEDPRLSVRRQAIMSNCEQPEPDVTLLTKLVIEGANSEQAPDPALKSFVDSGAEPTRDAICNIFVRRGIGFVQVNTGDDANQGFDSDDAFGRPGFQREPDGGELTALIYAARSSAIDVAQVLLDAGADVNQTSRYGWSPLLAATQNNNLQMGKFLIEHGADVNLANKGGWVPLYLATDNRNMEGGDYPTRTPDMDTLEYIKLLLDSGADPNARITESSETRTVFTNQWLDEDGATAFLRASQSGDVALMRLLLDHGADPFINTNLGVTPLAVAAGIGWVEGVTTEHSTEETVEAVKLLLELGLDPNFQAETGRTPLHGAAHKGATEVVKVLAAAGARLDLRDFGNTDNRGSPELAAHTWQAIDYADGLVRVGVQSAIPHPETAAVLRQLMLEQGLEAPPEGRTLESICIVEVCSVDYNPLDITN
jgi:ankyrin repeat protein